MSLTLKVMLDQVLGEIGLPEQDQYFGGSDNSITAIAQRVSANLSQSHYSLLRKEGSITMTTATQYSLPSDLRYIVPDTMQAEDLERYVNFPTSTGEWYYLKSRTTSSGIRFKARMADGYLEFEEPQAGTVILYEYITKNTISTAEGLAPTKSRFTIDTDVWLLDDDLFILDMIWRYGKVKNIEGWQADKQIFDEYNKKHIGNEAGTGTLNMSNEPYNELAYPYYPLWQA